MVYNITSMPIITESSTAGSMCMESSTHLFVFMYSEKSKFILQLPLIPLIVKYNAYKNLPRIINLSDSTCTLFYFPLDHQMYIWEDNTSYISIVEDDCVTSRFKHIDILVCFLQ